MVNSKCYVCYSLVRIETNACKIKRFKCRNKPDGDIERKVKSAWNIWKIIILKIPAILDSIEAIKCGFILINPLFRNITNPTKEVNYNFNSEEHTETHKWNQVSCFSKEKCQMLEKTNTQPCPNPHPTSQTYKQVREKHM